MKDFFIEQEVKSHKILQSITCDICGKFYARDDYTEIQEFHTIHFTGGYGSVFGDGSEIDCDICQRCLLKMLQNKYREDGILVSERPEYKDTP